MAKRPILYKAHDAAINNGIAITIKRVSISDGPFEIFKLNTIYIIYHIVYLIIELNQTFLIYKFYFFPNTHLVMNFHLPKFVLSSNF